MVTTKKIVIEYIQKEMRRNLNISLQENNTKEDSNKGKRGGGAINHIGNK